MNWSAALVALVPAGVVTVTSTVPVPAGAVAVIGGRADDGDAGGRVGAEVDPVAPVKLVPVIVTVVPAAVGPEVGLSAGDGRARRL